MQYVQLVHLPPENRAERANLLLLFLLFVCLKFVLTVIRRVSEILLKNVINKRKKFIFVN